MRLALLLFPLNLCQCTLRRDTGPEKAQQPAYRVHQERYQALRPGKATIRIIEMKVTKRSTLYGRYHDSRTGEDLGESAGFTSPPKRGIFEGYEMPYWMRLTDDGVGMHVGYVVPRTPVSFGCIRVPKDVHPLIFGKCRVGTKVEVVAPPVAGASSPVANRL
jgi:hypothetical protein